MQRPPTTEVILNAFRWGVAVLVLLFAGVASVQYCTEAGAREQLLAEVREDLDKTREAKRPVGDLPELYEGIRSLIRSGSTTSELTTRQLAHAKWCTVRQLAAAEAAAALPSSNAGAVGKPLVEVKPCPKYDGANATGRSGRGLPWDFVMDFSSASLMAAAMIASALVGALTGMFLTRKLDLRQIPLGLAAGFAVWLSLWGISGLLTTVPSANLNPYTAAILSLGAGLSTEKVFATVRAAFAAKLASAADQKPSERPGD